MDNNGVYKMKFEKSSFDINEDYDRLSEYEKERIAELDAETYFDYEEDGSYICFIITSPIEMKKYTSILSKNLIKFDFTELTKEVLSSKFDLEKELKPQLSTINSIKYSFFIDDVNEWIYNNLEIDMILDRISEVGIEHISQIEKDFLKNYHS
jgi:hypothetical protein